MKRSGEPNKLYYDVIIDHDPDHTEKRYKISSKAEKEIELLDPLIESPGDYNVCVSKFKIDTEAIPIMIPDLKQPQTKEDLFENYRYQTNYQIRFYLNVHDDIEDKNFTFDEIQNLYKYFHKDKYKPKILGYYKNNDGAIDENKIYVDNTDESCFIYSHEEFLTMFKYCSKLFLPDLKKINEKLFSGINVPQFNFEFSSDKLNFINDEKITDGDEGDYTYYENNEDGKLEKKTVHYKYTVKEMHIWFSPNLYKYFGNGFYTNFCNEEKYQGWWEIKYFLDTKSNLISDITYSVDDYVIPQSHTTLSNWHIMKGIVIGTDNLPVVGEYLPISHHDGSLTHYNNESYRKMLSDLGLEIDASNRGMFKKNTQMILDVYYPLSSSAGDVRSTIIFSADSAVNGQNIEMFPSSPLTRFNIWVKWLDIYGNLYDLYLYPGCSVDLRLAFTKKTVFREDVDSVSSEIVMAMPEEKKSKGDDRKPTGKNDGIVLDGADQYGWVHF